MRPLVAVLVTSLDGIVESPERWHFPYLDEELAAALSLLYAGSDTLLLGRATYESLAAVWPSKSGELADLLNGIAKVVVSTTMERAWWSNSTVTADDPAEVARRLKSRPGRRIIVTGSLTLTRSLLRANLVDELRLLIHPVVLGRGRRLFDGAAGELPPLALAGCLAFRAGVLDARFRPA